MQSHMRTIPLLSAILININIIIGAGLFVNPKPLTQFLQEWGFGVYVLGGLILLPIVVCLAQLATYHPTAGGLFVYGNTYISPVGGFVAGWGYFLGKTVSATFLAYTCSAFLQTLIPPLGHIPTNMFTIMLIFTLIALNMSGLLSLGGKVQWFIACIKAFPIGFVCLSGLYFWQKGSAGITTLPAFTNLAQALPIGVFAMVGFESLCSIAHLVIDPEKNLKRAMITSFLIVVGIAALFQFLMYCHVGSVLATTTTPLFVYVQQVLGGNYVLAHIFNTCMYVSIMGASFGMLTSNCWNLHTLAKNNLLPFSSALIQINKNMVPWVSLLVEAGFAVVILMINTHQIPLQNMAVFGMAVAYFLSAYAALIAAFKTADSRGALMPFLGLGGCSYILWLCLKRILISGLSYIFLVLLLAGIIIGWIRAKRG